MTDCHDTDLIIEILARHTGLETGDINLGMSLQDDLGLDSLDAVELLMTIEQETGKRFYLEDAGDARLVSDIVTKLGAVGGATTVTGRPPA